MLVEESKFSPKKRAVHTHTPQANKRPKRQKTRACLACRKLKSRCDSIVGNPLASLEESLSASVEFASCRRCKLLKLDCFYENPYGMIVQGGDMPVSAPALMSSFEPSTSDHPLKRQKVRSDSEKAHDESSRPVDLSSEQISAVPTIPPSTCIYRSVEITSQQTVQGLERPTLVASALSRLIGTNPNLHKRAHAFLLEASGASGSPTDSLSEAPPSVCIGKASAKLLSQQFPTPPAPTSDIESLTTLLAPYESVLRKIFRGLYEPFLPFLSCPVPASLTLTACRSESQNFALCTIYLAAIPHLKPSRSLSAEKQTLRKVVDVCLRRSLHTPTNNHLMILALHTCATLLLFPVDGFVEDRRPVSVTEQVNDGLLEFAHDLNPRVAIITAMNIARRLGHDASATRLPSLRQAYESASPAIKENLSQAELAHTIFISYTWIALVQFRAAIDVAEDRAEWDSLSKFEGKYSGMHTETVAAALLPPLPFLGPREQSKCCWMTHRAVMFAAARELRHLKVRNGRLSRAETEYQTCEYKRVLDEWRYRFGEQMRTISPILSTDPRGLSQHRFCTLFSIAEADSVQTLIGSVYQQEIVADMRQRMLEPLYGENVPWKSAAVVMLGRNEDPLAKALLMNLSFTDAIGKALGSISAISPVKPQWYDFVSSDTGDLEVPSLCLAARPNLHAGLFAVPVLAAVELRLSLIEIWGSSAVCFNPSLLSMVANCVNSLQSCRVSFPLVSASSEQFMTANLASERFQGPCEILMRTLAAAEERLQLYHIPSILGETALLARNKAQMRTHLEKLGSDAPELVRSIVALQVLQLASGVQTVSKSTTLTAKSKKQAWKRDRVGPVKIKPAKQTNSAAEESQRFSDDGKIATDDGDGQHAVRSQTDSLPLASHPKSDSIYSQTCAPGSSQDSKGFDAPTARDMSVTAEPNTVAQSESETITDPVQRALSTSPSEQMRSTMSNWESQMHESDQLRYWFALQAQFSPEVCSYLVPALEQSEHTGYALSALDLQMPFHTDTVLFADSIFAYECEAMPEYDYESASSSSSRTLGQNDWPAVPNFQQIDHDWLAFHPYCPMHPTTQTGKGFPLPDCGYSDALPEQRGRESTFASASDVSSAPHTASSIWSAWDWKPSVQ